MKYKDCVCTIYILYYILAYIQHNGDVSLEKNDVRSNLLHTFRYQGHLLGFWDTQLKICVLFFT